MKLAVFAFKLLEPLALIGVKIIFHRQALVMLLNPQTLRLRNTTNLGRDGADRLPLRRMLMLRFQHQIYDAFPNFG